MAQTLCEKGGYTLPQTTDTNVASPEVSPGGGGLYHWFLVKLYSFP